MNTIVGPAEHGTANKGAQSGHLFRFRTRRARATCPAPEVDADRPRRLPPAMAGNIVQPHQRGRP
ncbi:hypothetical protein ACFQZ8_30805, partial [Micromonospora azadirachtae]